ncbi:hypothetical protein F7R19_29615, partial [Cupriavidus pauculus]
GRQINEKVGEVTISFRIVKNSEPISLAEGSFAFMRLVLQQPVKSLFQSERRERISGLDPLLKCKNCFDKILLVLTINPQRIGG